VGEKTAISLLTEYDNLDSIYEHLDAFSPSIRNKLELGKESAQMSRTLAKIVTDLVIPWDLEKVNAEKFAIDQEKIEAIFRQLEFRSLLPRLTALYPDYTQAGAKGQQLSLFSETSETGKPLHGGEIVFEVVDNADKLEHLVKQMEAAKFISFDTETTSTDQMRAKLVGISLAMDGTKGYYIPVGHSAEPERQLPVARVLSAIGPAMTDANIGKIGHNLKYDYVVLADMDYALLHCIRHDDCRMVM
jgi:DNA polymerase-1